MDKPPAARQSDPPGPPAALGAALRGGWRVLRLTWLGFGFGGSYVLAAAIAFYALVCLGPLGLLMVSALRLLLGSSEAAYGWLQHSAQALGGEAAARIMSQVDSLLAHPEGHVVSALSVLLLIWAGLRLFEVVERSLTGVWPGRRLRGFLGRKLMALVLMAVAGGLFACFVLLNVLLAVARGWLQQTPGLTPEALDWATPPLLAALQFLLAALAYGLVYKLAPVQAVPTRAALAGALAAAVLWQVGSAVFTGALARSPQYDALYGGLAGVVIFSMWALMGAWVLLWGAHLAAAYQHVFIERRGRDLDAAFLAALLGRGEPG